MGLGVAGRGRLERAGVCTCWLGNWQSTEVILLAYWAITLRTAFSTGTGMRPATLVMISCSSSRGREGCRRVIMSFWTQSFSCRRQPHQTPLTRAQRSSRGRPDLPCAPPFTWTSLSVMCTTVCHAHHRSRGRPRMRCTPWFAWESPSAECTTVYHAHLPNSIHSGYPLHGGMPQHIVTTYDSWRFRPSSLRGNLE